MSETQGGHLSSNIILGEAAPQILHPDDSALPIVSTMGFFMRGG